MGSSNSSKDLKHLTITFIPITRLLTGKVLQVSGSTALSMDTAEDVKKHDETQQQRN